MYLTWPDEYRSTTCYPRRAYSINAQRNLASLPVEQHVCVGAQGGDDQLAREATSLTERVKATTNVEQAAAIVVREVGSKKAGGSLDNFFRAFRETESRPGFRLTYTAGTHVIKKTFPSELRVPAFRVLHASIAKYGLNALVSAVQSEELEKA